jgi:hypothetical protein
MALRTLFRSHRFDRFAEEFLVTLASCFNEAD